MASFGRFDNREFEAFANQFADKIKGELATKAVEDALFKTAKTAVKLVRQKTPVDSGTLRRNWKASGAKRAGNMFMIDIYNNVEYAPFIENGHRIVRNGKNGRTMAGYQPGVFMLRDTIREVDRNWEQLVGKKFLKALDEILGV